MKTIDVQITFPEDEDSYVITDTRANTTFSCPASSLPNKGDGMNIDGILCRTGYFVVSHRIFEVQEDRVVGVTLVLEISDEDVVQQM